MTRWLSGAAFKDTVMDGKSSQAPKPNGFFSVCSLPMSAGGELRHCALFTSHWCPFESDWRQWNPSNQVTQSESGTNTSHFRIQGKPVHMRPIEQVPRCAQCNLQRSWSAALQQRQTQCSKHTNRWTGSLSEETKAPLCHWANVLRSPAVRSKRWSHHSW